MASGGGTFYYHYDLLGSVTNVTSASGATEWTYQYEPFGGSRSVTQNDPTATANMMQFASEYQDRNGLYNLRARQYDALTGRMTSVDPVAASAGQPVAAAYQYAGDQPTVMTDPSGQTFQPAQAISASRMRPSIRPAQIAPSSIGPSVFPPVDASTLDDGMTAQTRTTIAWLFFLEHGMSDVHNAAMLGNFLVESAYTMNPRTLQKGGGGGLGIGQWGGSRWTDLVAYAHKRQWSEWSLNAQLEWSWHELHAKEASAYKQVLATHDIRSATLAVRVYYERPNPTEAHDKQRIEQANGVYAIYHGRFIIR